MPPSYPKDKPHPETLPKASGFANSERNAELRDTPALNAVLEMTIRKTAEAKVPGPVYASVAVLIQQMPVITASQNRLLALASANALITGITAIDSKLERVIVSVQANVAQTAFSATTDTKKAL